MARSKTHKRQKRAADELLEKGAYVTALGIALLVVPLFLGASPTFRTLAGALRTPGLMALGLGLVLLGIRFALKDKAEPIPSLVDFSAMRQEPTSRQNAFGEASPPAPGGSAAEDRREPFSRATSTRQPATKWSPAVFAAIEWRRFEAVCETLFAQAGFDTRSQSHGADGGVDIWLHSANAQGPVAVVQCKHWNGKAVGVKEIREFFGVMASHQLKRGTYATTSTYTADAQKFAKDNGINALDGAALLSLIAKRTPEQQQALLEVAHEGEYWRPTCASCGIKLVERTPAKGGAGFWGCSNYPRCKTRMQMA
ncbi:MAG: restriction endonuclease, partial [Burkholderiaceae bacterium]|nr:restriction endonuclease [Polaromonas sp.]MDO8774711.1 restriction endonuclease [Burkholderiaceae bacterium]